MSRPHGRRLPYCRRVRIGFHCAAMGVVHGALLVTAALVLSPHAHSAPLSSDQAAYEYWAHHGSSVCRTLDAIPRLDGIVLAALNIFRLSGLNDIQASQVINLAIHFTCPQHQGLLDQYQVAQHRGGVVA